MTAVEAKVIYIESLIKKSASDGKNELLIDSDSIPELARELLRYRGFFADSEYSYELQKNVLKIKW